MSPKIVGPNLENGVSVLWYCIAQQHLDRLADFMAIFPEFSAVVEQADFLAIDEEMTGKLVRRPSQSAHLPKLMSPVYVP